MDSIRFSNILYSRQNCIIVRLSFFIIVFCSCFYSVGQLTVIVGSNDGANGNTGYPCPLQDFYTSQRGQYLYNAASLAAAGIPNGATITDLGWLINPSTISTAGTGPHQMEEINISLKNTTINSLNISSWETGLTNVFGSGNYSYVDNTLIVTATATITPFVYTGNGLILELCSGNSSATWSSNPQVQWTTNVGYNASHQWRADGVAGCGNTNTLNYATATTRPRLQITYTLGSAPPSPSSISSSTSTICNGNSITLSVVGGSGTTYWFAGSCGSTTGSSIGFGSSISVSPSTTTTYYARNYSAGNWSNTCASKTITVNSIPSTPSAPTSNSPQCGSVTITRSGTPPAGATWYWQGPNSNGTSTSLGSGTTYTATTSGTYYIRARNSSGCWSSTSGSVAVSISTAPTTPSTLTSNSPQCGSVTITRGGTPPAGTTWYWQGNNGNGFSTTLGSGTTYTATASGTYYIRARNSSGCWSTLSSSTTVVVDNSPSVPALPTSNSPQCESVTITRSGTPPAGTTWYWQGTNPNGTSTTLGSGSTYSATTTGTYYIRAKNNSANCWSTFSQGIPVQVLNSVGQQINPIECDLYTSPDGQVYSVSGQYQAVLNNAYGCDSIIPINLVIHPSYSITDIILACESYSWIDGTTYTSDNNTAVYTIPTVFGCDSVVYLDLSVSSPSNDTTIVQSTSIGSYTMNGLTYSESGIYYQTLLDQFGCDSIVELQLFIDYSSIDEIEKLKPRIYPNPSESGIFHIDLSEPEGVQFWVKDMLGREINGYYNNGILNLTGEASGCYLIEFYFTDTDHLITQRLIISN